MLIDIHNHVIPNVDDGPDSMASALELIDLAMAHGISHVVATPHIHSGRYENNPINIAAGLIQLQTKLEANGQKLILAAASEARIDDSLIQRILNKQVLYLGYWESKPALLLEFPTNHYPHGAIKLVTWLLKQGIQPIIAHPERHVFFRDEPVRLNKYLMQGCLLQITAASVLGEFGKEIADFSYKLLQSDKVTFIASDAHNMAYRPFRLVQAQQFLQAQFSDVECQKWFYDNPHKLTQALFAHPQKILVA